MTEREFAELSAAYALGALTPDEERAYRDALAEHPEWRRLADLDLETAATLADGVAPAPLPEDLRDRLADRLGASLMSLDEHAGSEEPEDADLAADDAEEEAFGHSPLYAAMSAAAASTAADTVPVARVSQPDESVPPSIPSPPPIPAPEEAARRAAAPPTEVVQAIQRRNWTRGVIALVGTIAVLVGIGWGVGVIADAVRTPEIERLLSQIEDADDARSASGDYGETGGVTVHWSESVGAAVLVADGLPEPEADAEFQAWIVRGGDYEPAASFAADDGDAMVELDEPMSTDAAVVITIEPEGSARDEPSTDPLVTIEPLDTSAEG